MPRVPHIASVRERHYGDITIRSDLVREEYEFFAKKARISERYDDVLKIVLKIIELGWLPLTSSERGLFFSGAIGVYRRLYKDYKAICDNGEDVDGAIFWQYRTAIESEVRELCIDMIKVIVDTLLPTATTEREVADYLRMKGIFHNSLCHLEYIAGEDTFISAQRLSEDLDAVDRIRLVTARAYSLFTYYMSHDRSAAVEIATHALRNAQDVLDERNEEVPYESASVIRQLENSINQWNTNEHFDDLIQNLRNDERDEALGRGAAPAA